MSPITILAGQRIRAFRKQAGMTQAQLADKADMNASYVSQIERGIKSPTIETLESLAIGLGVSFEVLLANMVGGEVKNDTAAMIYDLAVGQPPEAQKELLEIVSHAVKLIR